MTSIVYENVVCYSSGNLLACSEVSTSTIDGSARVEMSPNWSLSLSQIFLKIRLIIFPDLVFGRPGTNYKTHYISKQ